MDGMRTIQGRLGGDLVTERLLALSNKPESGPVVRFSLRDVRQDADALVDLCASFRRCRIGRRSVGQYQIRAKKLRSFLESSRRVLFGRQRRKTRGRRIQDQHGDDSEAATKV